MSESTEKVSRSNDRIWICLDPTTVERYHKAVPRGYKKIVMTTLVEQAIGMFERTDKISAVGLLCSMKPGDLFNFLAGEKNV